MRRSIPTIFVLASLVANGAPVQVATVFSTAEFQLREALIKPGQGVPSWPAMAGDKLKSGDAPVLATFPDGSTVTLQPHSEAVIEVANGVPVFRLLCGAADYSLTSLPAVTLMARDKLITAAKVIGSYKIDGGCRTIPGGWWTVGGIAAGAAALGIGIELATRGAPSVSASH